MSIEYLLDKASEAEITEHLRACDADFVPPLTGRVEIGNYARKIASNATRFEAWSDGTMIGFVAVYCNDKERRIAYITSVSVLRAWTGKGIAACLISRCVEHAKASGMRQIILEVASKNTPAIRLYEKSGFITSKANAQSVSMGLNLERCERHE